MQFSIIIQARTGSKRFPSKILHKIDHRSVIEFMIDSILTKFQKKNILIATTTNKKDDRLIKLLKIKQINYFRGSEKNVLHRYIGCCKKFKVKNVIHVTADCPLVDVGLIKRMLKVFIKKKLDYLSNTYPPKKSRFPDGTDIQIYKYTSLKKLSKLAKKAEDKEHVTNFFWKNPKIFKTMVLRNKNNLSQYKYSLDYKSELTLIKEILKKLKLKKYKPIYQNVAKIIDSNKVINDISKKNLKKFKENRKDLF
tara:strand:- start:1049 stop:1804 length:756 start_codon:yes stop_codon:yes gene_type:complete